jgi:hypothetical protein
VPLNVFLQYVVPVLGIPALILFKYGKPRGYLQDWLLFHMRPHVYCALEPDSQQRLEYLKAEDHKMPLTLRQWEDSLRQPALCELLPVRDYLDGCIIRTNGCFVAGYEAAASTRSFIPTRRAIEPKKPWRRW